jgi:hypothetical protein
MPLYTAHPSIPAFVESLVAVLLTAGVIHLLGVLGSPGRAVREWMAHAPGLDGVVLWLTMGPPVIAWVMAAANGRSGWAVLSCIAASVAGQIVALYLWCWGHELVNLKKLRAAKGARLVSSINRNLGGPVVGRLCNHFGLLWMLWGVPAFNLVRLLQYWVYPVLVVLTRLPRYTQRDWVNVSRHKFDGLVGHDLIWCLYCDWMTGIWSLGTEMLRNIESFWCPIRFLSPEKCANCAQDFPDVDHGWVKETAGLADAAKLVDERYPAPDGSNAWLGHPVRLTVKGRP